MTIRELIEKLKEFDPDLEAVVSGYEEGYDPIKIVSVVSVEKSTRNEHIYGTYTHAILGQKPRKVVHIG